MIVTVFAFNWFGKLSSARGSSTNVEG